MLESVLAGVLNRFLSQYVDNLSTRDLNVGIWSGDIKLRNLRLKKEALDKFRLPVDVIEGYLGDLTLSIPWSNLKGKPVRVLIENVYMLAVPTDSSKSTPEEDEARSQAAKQEKLATADLLAAQPGGLSSEDEAKNESFTASLVTKIVDNLQIEVRNIHIRYEDNLSVPGHPFSAGITLSGFSAVSTDEFWQPTFITNSLNGIHKLAKLESLAVYFDTDAESLAGYSIEEAIVKFTDLIAKEGHTPDHQFILKPVSGEGRLVMNSKIDSTTPKTDAELLFKELGFVLDADQYRDVLSMIDLFHFYIRQRDYRPFRPALALLEENKSKALWKFALDAIQSEVHEKNKKWSWGYFAERRDDRKDYVRLFKAKHKKEISLDDARYLVDLEKKLAYRDIRFYRSIARSELRKERAAAKQDEEVAKPVAAGGGWLGYLGWGSATAAVNVEADDDVLGLNEEQRKELYQAIEWNEREAVAAAVDLPKDFMQLRVKTKLETGSFALRVDPHGKNSDLISLNFDGFALDMIQRPDNFEAVLALGGLRVFDGTCEGSVHPQIVRVKEVIHGKEENDGKDQRITELRDEDREAEDDDGLTVASPPIVAPFFSLKFEHNPLDGRADNALAVRLRPMEIVYSRIYVEAIVKFFKPPESQLESVGALIDVASVTLEGIRKETRAGLEYALTQHKTVDLLLDLNAPIIIIPEDLTSKNCTHIVLDAGHISVESHLADKNVLNEIKLKEKKEYQDEDYKRLEDLMYDQYHVRLESAQLLVGPSLQVCLNALNDNNVDNHSLGSELHILERTSLTFLAQNCILAQAPNLTRFKVSGSLPALRVNISDKKYKSMMKMIDVAIPRFDSVPPTTRLHPAPIRRPAHHEDDEYHPQHHDHSTSHGGEEDKDEFFDTEDITDGISNAHQKTFELMFSVDRIQASIYRSNNDPTKEDRLLANAVLEGFQFEFGLRPYDMSVDILLRSLYVEDKMVDEQNEFRHLVTSKQLDAVDGEQGQDLVRIRYQGVQKVSPEFMTVHEGIDKTVDVELSTINVVVTRGSILTLFDWVMTTFTDGPNGPLQLDTPLGEEPLAVEETNDKLRVKVKLTSIIAVLNEDGFRLGTLSLSAADVSVMLRSPTMRVAASLGNLSFVDDFSSDGPLEMLSIQGDELADFQYETYDPLDLASYPGHDTLIYLRTGSLQLTFIEEPVHRLLTFFSKFARMKALYDAATQAAAQRATEISTTIQKMHYDILIRTPIVRFPHESDSMDLIVANLGEISLSNRFEVSDALVVTKITAGLRAIRLTSILHETSKPYSLQIIDDVDIGVDITLTQDVDDSKTTRTPATQIAATMSDVKMNLTQAQYGFLISLSKTIPRAFSPSIEDDGLAPLSESTDITPIVEIGHGFTETVDLSPELANIALRSDGVQIQLKSSLELVFNVGTVYLEIFTATALDSDTLRNSSLAKFSLNETGVRYKMLSNGSMEAEVVVRSFTVHDTRTSRQTKFREMIPATSHGGHQFMISYNQSGGTDQSAIANVTIDSPKVIFALDPVMALLDYFMSPFPPTIAQEEATKDSVEEEEIKEVVVAAGKSFAFRINVVSPTIILLDDPERADSEAMILSISQVQMTQQSTLALSITKIGMFLCKMDKPKETIRFLDNFDITLSLDNRSDGGHTLTNIDVNIQPLVLRVSFRDLLLIQNIINRAIEMSTRAASPPPRPNLATLASQKSTKTITSTTKSTGTRRRSSVGGLAAQIIMTKENLTATIDGFQLILIGDTHDLPMIDVKAGQFSAQVKDWSSDMQASVMITPFINFFNLKVSHWEPLMDPWEFAIRVNRSISTGLLSISLSSQKRLELNITATFIELALTTAAILDKDSEKGFSHTRGANAPFLVKNRTGYPISIWSDTSDDSNEPASAKLDNGADIPWRFDDWRKMRENILSSNHNSLTVHFDGMTWDRLKQVSVEREGQRVFSLRPKLNNVTHRLLCDIKLVDNVKVITFRSTFQVENRTLVVAEMVVVDANGKRASPIYKIPPGEDYSVPILAAYDSRIRLRPDPGFGHSWSTESYGWQDLIKRPTRTITCKSQKEEAFRFQAYAVHDRSDPLTRIYPRLTLCLRAPLEIQNLLPYDIRIRVYDKHIEHNWKTFLRKGGVIPMNIAELSHLLLLSVEVQDTVFGWSDFAIINTDNYEDMEVEQDLMLQDKSGVKLNLRLHYQRQENSGGAFKVQIYSPYLLLNKTGCNFGLKTQSFLSSAKLVAGLEEFKAGTKLDPIQPPFMFSFAKDDRRNKVQLRINDSTWSKSLSLETIGIETEVILPSNTGAEEIHIGLKVTEGLGDYKLAKVVTLYPRFVIKNDTEDDLRFREFGSKRTTTISAGQRHSIEFLSAGKEPQLLLAYSIGTSDWSAPFKLQDIGESYTRIRRVDADEALLQVNVMLAGPCIFIKLATHTGKWPYLLRNDSDYQMEVSQADAYDPLGPGSASIQPILYTLAPQSKMAYAWDLPASTSKQLKIRIGERDRLVNVLEIGSQVPFRFKVGGKVQAVSIDVRAEGPTQSIRFSNYAAEDSVFKLQQPNGDRSSDLVSRAQSVGTSSSKEAVFEAVDVDIVTSFSFGVDFEGVGISIVTHKMQELVYVSFRSVSATYTDSTTSIAYDLGVKWIQIDNQLFGGLYPILLYPSVIPTDGKDLEIHPSLQASVVVLKDEAHGVTYFKYASILIQQMTVEVDEDFLFSLLEFVNYSTGAVQNPVSKLTDEPDEIPEPQSSSSGGEVYFEVLHLQPVQLDLSFMRTDRVNVDQKIDTRNPLFFLINALTMTIGNVNDAPVRLNALVIENVRVSLPVLQERLTVHYRQEFFRQLYRVLLSADILGTPVALFSNVSSGVRDFFVEPYDSVMMNGSKDLGIGIARGAGSLAKKTVFGLTNSMTKFTGSVGKGLSAVTLDKQYQSQRRMRQFRNKPKHALYGVSAGAASLLTSVASGFEGVVTKPLEGAESGGAFGFFKGVGKGLVGAVTKPVVGVFDLASNITEGIRNTTTVFDASGIDRARLPRFIAADGILRPYQQREAIGQDWLKNLETGKYATSENYVCHLDVPSSDITLVAILTSNRILLVKVTSLRIMWDVPLSDLQTISLDPGGITLVLRGSVQGPFIAVPDQSSRLWFFRKLDIVVTAYNQKRVSD